MKTFTVAVPSSVYMSIRIEAETLEDAVKEAEAQRPAIAELAQDIIDEAVEFLCDDRAEAKPLQVGDAMRGMN